MKNRESGISPLPLCSGVMKDPETEAVCRIGNLWSFLYPLWGGVMKNPKNEAVCRIRSLWSFPFPSVVG